MKLFGSITALVSPFRHDSVDEEALRSLVEWQIGSGTHGLLACGTTGESTTLSSCEHLQVLEIVVDAAKGRVPVLVGVSSSSTSIAVNLAKHAQQGGADAVLVNAPFYNRPTQDGLYRHFIEVSNAIDLPIVLYNIPQRAAVEISFDTMCRLEKDVPSVIGVKDATASLARASMEYSTMPKDWVMLSGDDASALGYMAHGGKGCISVTSNVAPDLCAKMQEACIDGNFREALSIHNMLEPLRRSLFIESNPIGVKYALSRLGYIRNEMRLPLVPASTGASSEIELAMEQLRLIS